ncbi:MAG: T9SS type A sorting domain-containing protein [Calditrichaeota bacterium]|nr:T9SS type A sorting domain-containing protein [Calditrichota bacterium]MCB9369782.1 T9SS type A sorting domain-containing protein [Calditrichota bacterium]
MPALLLLLLLPCLSFAQPDTTWSRSFLVNDRCYLYDAAVVHDTLIVGVGYAQIGFTDPDYDYLICAYTTSGDSVYAQTVLASTDNESLNGLIALSGDTMVAAGWDIQDGREVSLVSFLASTGEVLWQRGYAREGRTKSWNLCKLTDGRFAVTGYRGGTTDPTHSDVWVLLCEANGDTVWTRTVGGNDTDIGNDIIQKPDGNLVVAAQTRSYGAGSTDVWELEFDLDGNQIGTGRTYGTSNYETCFNVIADPVGTLWIVGRSDVNGTSGFVGVHPTDGAPYSLAFSSTGFADRFVGATPWFGGMLFVGKSGPGATDTGPFMRAVDDENLTRWVWRYGNLGAEGGFNNIVRYSSGGAVAVGAIVADDNAVSAYILSLAPPAGIHGIVRSAETGDPVPGARVSDSGGLRYALTDVDGVYQFDIEAGTYNLVVNGACIEADTVFGVQVVENESVQINFEVGEPNVANLQSSVNIISQNETDGTANVSFSNSGSGSLNYTLSVEGISPPGAWLTVAPDHGVLAPNASTSAVITAHADTTNDGNFEFYGQLTIRSNACPDTVMVLPILVSVLDVNDHSELPAQFSLSPAYPNPFNSNTSITLSIPNETVARLEVYNIAGKWVKTLVDGRMSAGNHNINIDLSGEATGLYFVRAAMPNTFAVQKLLYIR